MENIIKHCFYFLFKLNYSNHTYFKGLFFNLNLKNLLKSKMNFETLGFDFGAYSDQIYSNYRERNNNE